VEPSPVPSSGDQIGRVTKTRIGGPSLETDSQTGEARPSWMTTPASSGGEGNNVQQRVGASWRNSNGFHRTCPSRHSNQSPTKPLKIELSTHREMRTSLGDHGSQVRVLSPRFAADCSAVKPLPADCSRFQLVGISHSTGTSTYSRIDCLSCQTTLFRAKRPAMATSRPKRWGGERDGLELIRRAEPRRTVEGVEPASLGCVDSYNCHRPRVPAVERLGERVVAQVRRGRVPRLVTIVVFTEKSA
jgi:hypothetical protein